VCMVCVCVSVCLRSVPVLKESVKG
jgi:hypothetical protein